MELDRPSNSNDQPPCLATSRGGLPSAAILLLIVAGTLGAFWGGPPLGDHEGIVAECARNMRLSGDWLLPRFLGEPFIRKPPLPYWLIAGLSYVFPDDPGTHLPVTATVARVPSAVAAFGTVMLLWYLASAMFNRRTGQVTAVLAASSLFVLLYAPNATVEMILTFCCTWAYTHFWLAIQHPAHSWQRRTHLFFFYLAMGLGMMAKGPLPLAMVAMPLAIWWFTERPLRMLADNPREWRAAATTFVRDLWPRTRAACIEMWLMPGLLVFALCFVPWMIAVGRQHPGAWGIWIWQYWQRAKGNYDDTRPRGFLYYIPVVIGLIMPWLFLFFEGVVSPWIRKYAQQRRALLFAGLWALIGVLIMSAETFKKPYYVVPALPGLVLLLAVVAERFYSTPIRRVRLAWACWGGLVAATVALVIVTGVKLTDDFPEVANGLTVIAAVALTFLLAAGAALIRGYRWAALGTTAATFVLAYLAVWHGYGRVIANVDKISELAQLLDEKNVPADAKVFWVDSRPDSRLSFYFNRPSRPLVAPSEIVAMFTDRTANREKLAMYVIDRAGEELAKPTPVYLILDRKAYDQARALKLLPQVHEIGAVKDPDRARNDWMVISNFAAP